MAIKGRHKYMVYLDANHVEKIKDFMDAIGYENGLSGFLNDYCENLRNRIEEAEENDTIGDLIFTYSGNKDLCNYEDIE